MIREIGSEYQRLPIEEGQGISMPGNGTLVFSGRTAIEIVLKEIPNLKKAMLPSYCCKSMIEPFDRFGIEIVQYSVYYNQGLRIEIDNTSDVDVLLWCNYFGFISAMPDMSEFISRGGIIIEDITHSFLSEQSFHFQSNYLVASLRKWGAVNCGGYCASLEGELKNVPKKKPSDDFIKARETAMKLKASYLNGKIDLEEKVKQKFLSIYAECNNWLEKNYSGLTIDSWSRLFLMKMNVTENRATRRRNAGVLYKGLKNKVIFLFEEEQMDCPLFVPILLPGKRDAVRRELIVNNIYCPVHWPKPEGFESNLYEMELSLVCDQRYDIYDMKRIVHIIEKLL